jgi:hypothetical protein
VHFVQRREEGDRLKALLVRGKSAAVGITAALRGAGGYGKTQLASWLAHQKAVEDAFYDGILWVGLGEHPNVHDKIEGLIDQLTGKKASLPDATMVAARLKEVIGHRHMLLVIDDVWNKSDLDPFLGGAPNLVRLVTTRFDHVLPPDAAKVPADAMQPAEAATLLAVGLPPAEVEPARPALLALAQRLGEWPLLLTLANAQLCTDVEDGAPTAKAIASAARRYDEVGLKAFNRDDEADRNSAACLSIEASVNRLVAAEGEAARLRFDELAIFPEDSDIPSASITRLWQHTAGLNAVAGAELLRKLRRWALLQGYNRATETVRLHDVMRKYLRDRAGDTGVARQAQALTAAYTGSNGADLQGSERLYYYRHLPEHLHEAGELEKLDALLMSPAWMQAKLAAVGARPLIDDYRYARTQAQRLTGQTLDLSSGAETETLNRAFTDLAAAEFHGARAHLRAAAEHLTTGTPADSIRESIRGRVCCSDDRWHAVAVRRAAKAGVRVLRPSGPQEELHRAVWLHLRRRRHSASPVERRRRQGGRDRRDLHDRRVRGVRVVHDREAQGRGRRVNPETPGPPIPGEISSSIGAWVPFELGPTGVGGWR